MSGRSIRRKKLPPFHATIKYFVARRKVFAWTRRRPYMHLWLHVCAAAMPMNKSRPLLRSHGEPSHFSFKLLWLFHTTELALSPAHLFHQRVVSSPLLHSPPSPYFASLSNDVALSTILYPSPPSFRSKNLPSFIERSRARECTRVTSSRDVGGRGGKKV